MNLRQTSGTEIPRTYLNKQLLVLLLGSNIFSPTLFTHLFRTRVSLSVAFLYILTLPLSALGKPSIFTSSQKKQTSNLFKRLSSDGAGERMEEDGVGKNRGRASKFPGWVMHISLQSPRCRENTTSNFPLVLLLRIVVFSVDHTNCPSHPHKHLSGDITPFSPLTNAVPAKNSHLQSGSGLPSWENWLKQDAHFLHASQIKALNYHKHRQQSKLITSAMKGCESRKVKAITEQNIRKLIFDTFRTVGTFAGFLKLNLCHFQPRKTNIFPPISKW